jgi:ParB family transcriptional regulator, chromosome partitioning protein
MTSRKDQLKNMFQPADAPDEARETSVTPPARTTSGAVKAMGLSLGGIQREIEEARQLKDALIEGERIVELDPALIDPSPYTDRLSDGAHNDEEFASLVESLKESGQQIPVLVRPHTKKHGRFETAYGHRRIKAARELDIKVRAIVRPLDDGALLLAQGKENAERRNLSFIEKSLFVHGMLEAGVERAAAQAALGAHKAEMTRFVQIAQAIPIHIARAIGPAPKAGRPRWMALGELLQTEAGRVKADDEIDRQEFRDALSDRRFQMLFDRLNRLAKAKAAGRVINAGTLSVTVSSAGNATRFEIADSAFASWLEDNMADLANKFAEDAA